jgi:pimeloyl-ACP methyl ester carboxylesterase
MFSTLERAQGQDYTEEQKGLIIRTYVATIEAIEAQLTEKNVPVPPINLPPTPPIPAEKDVFDIGMVTKDRVHIQGTYYRPAAVDAPGVVLLHMLGRNRGDWDTFARQLQDAGYGVIAIDLRGHGESEGEREWDKMTQDAAIAASFIRSRPEINPDRIALIGASIGANIAINYGAQDPEVAGVALLSPGLNYRGVTTEDAVKQYGVRPLFIAASSEDDYAAKSARKLDSLAQGPHQLLILENQGHGTQMLGKDNGLEEALQQWLAASMP